MDWISLALIIIPVSKAKIAYTLNVNLGQESPYLRVIL